MKYPVINHKKEFILFFSGINLILFNYIIIHPATILVHEEEYAILMFTIAYFLGISLGYKISDKITTFHIHLLLPVILLVQMGIIIGLPDFAVIIQKIRSSYLPEGYHLSDLMITGTEFISLILLVVFGTSVYAIFLPRIIQNEKRRFKRFYSIEILGSLAGLLLIPVLAGFSHPVILSAYFIIMLLLYSFAGMGRIMIVFLVILTSIYIYRFDHFDKILSTYYYHNKYSRYEQYHVEYIRYTPYHKIEILLNTNSKRKLFLNGRIQFGEGSHKSYSYYLSEYPAGLLKSPKVCVLGCGSMSSVGRIGESSPKIQIVDIDEGVFETSRKYFTRFNRLNELNNWQFQADDAKHFMSNTREKYDLILHDIPPANTRQTALTYTREFFSSVKKNLTDDGIFSISSLRSFRSPKTDYTRRLVATLANVFDNYFILEMRNRIFFYGLKATFRLPDKDSLYQAILHDKRKRVRVLTKDDIDKLIRDEEIITVNNLRDLIYE